MEGRALSMVLIPALVKTELTNDKNQDQVEELADAQT